MRKKVSKIYVVIGILFLVLGANALVLPAQNIEPDLPQPTIRNLSSWLPVYFDFPNSVEVVGFWHHPGYHAAQWNNCDPCFLLCPDTSLKWSVDCRFWVNSTHDDDFIGFTFGYHNKYHFCTVDWLANWSGNNLWDGFTVREFYTDDLANYWLGDFKSRVSTPPEMIVLDQLHEVPGGNNLSWEYFHWYDFHLEYDTGSYSLEISDGPTVLFSSSGKINQYRDEECHFGFYDCSLKGAEFRDVSVTSSPVGNNLCGEHEARCISLPTCCPGEHKGIMRFTLIQLFLATIPQSTPLFRLLTTLFMV